MAQFDYEELPPTKINEFQIDDLVRVYFSDGNEEKPVKQTIQGLIEKVDGDFIVVGGESYLFYQARKLKLIGPTFLWFRPLNKTINGRESYHIIDFPPDPSDTSWTKVQTL